jgi:sulfate adenylyltransferase subunit 1
LENVSITPDSVKNREARFQVQYVIRPQTEELHDYRGYAGKILSGSYLRNQQVLVLPAGIETTIEKIEHNQQEVECALEGMPVVMHLRDNIDITRGTIIIPVNNNINIGKDLEATICWMDNNAFQAGQKFLLQQSSFRTKVIIKEILAKVDIHLYQELDAEGDMKLNDICKVHLRAAEAISYDRFIENKFTGAFILINENTNNTVAAGTFY